MKPKGDANNIECIERAIVEADAGDFASKVEVDKVFAKWRSSHISSDSGRHTQDQ